MQSKSDPVLNPEDFTKVPEYQSCLDCKCAEKCLKTEEGAADTGALIDNYKPSKDIIR